MYGILMCRKRIFSLQILGGSRLLEGSVDQVNSNTKINYFGVGSIFSYFGSGFNSSIIKIGELVFMQVKISFFLILILVPELQSRSRNS